jgi:hypothetical protein
MRLDPEELAEELMRLGRSSVDGWSVCLWNAGRRDPIGFWGRRAMMIQLGAQVMP